ncbi:dTDP-4-dehydrorhamnose 3,5-epimerase [bacterium]|nr:dTDP-4-dehydrorhamnose 3,5-epimerase [bacterium]
MGKFRIIETPIKGLLLIETKVFRDDRGFFMESYNQKELKEIGFDLNFVQDNHSFSRKGVIRGLHFQLKYPQGKLVRVISGKVFDVAVDLRVNSPTFGEWFGVELMEGDGLQFYIPPGFAHGFISLEENTHFFYKCTEYYNSEDDFGIIWNDPKLNISWPLDKVENIIVSEKDKKLPSFEEVKDILIRENYGKGYE